MTPTTHLTDIDSIAWVIDCEGINAVPTEALRAMVSAAVAGGADQAVAGILADPLAPTVVRNRAFGYLARYIHRDDPAVVGPLVHLALVDTAERLNDRAPSEDKSSPAMSEHAISA